MKKYKLIMAVITSIVMISCGSGSTTTESSDSTGVKVDSVPAVVDTTAVETPVGESSSEGQPVK